MVGAGMIFDETYRPAFAGLLRNPLYSRETGLVETRLAGIASKTGSRAKKFLASGELGEFAIVTEPDSVSKLVECGVDAVCVATPDDRHFDACKAVLQAGKHLFVEKPSVLSLSQLDELCDLANKKGVLAKVVYHKLLDPDHKRLRSLVTDGVLKHVNSGYCTLLEPKSISGSQFSEWIVGRNPGTYVAVHYIKLIDFTFGGRLKAVTASGQRGLVGPADGNTWDSTQLRMIYEYPDGREAAFDIHTSWVTPDNFPGYVEQEVQFRFDNGIWLGHSRKRGVEVTVEDKTPLSMKNSLNNHYNAPFIEPWGERVERGYGIEVIQRFFKEVAYVEFGKTGDRDQRLREMRELNYNDLAADRQTVAAVQALEAILENASQGKPDAVVYTDHSAGGLVLFRPGDSTPNVLYDGKVSPT